MNYHYGFFDAPAVPAYPNSMPAMKPAIYFIEPPCLADANYECLGCDTATLRNNGLHLNCGYLIPSNFPLCDEAVLEPDLPWYP